MRKLEIYGTLGPSCCDEEILYQMFLCGMTGMRLNLSHVDLEDVKEWIDHFKNASIRASIKPDLLIDMQGPELRIGKVGALELKIDQIIDLSDLKMPEIVMSQLNAGQQILLDDGKIKVEVVNGSQGKVIQEGVLLSNKSIALPGLEILLPTLTKKDLMNIQAAGSFGVTGLMQPFVRNKEDLICVRKALDDAGSADIKIYAKIENKSGIDQLESLIPYCDQIIIARGDLGNAVTLPMLPSYQRYIENICKEKGMPYMVVTEMLYSMNTKAVPTRAEVSDIYHAVYNGAQSIMLTGETASGKFPIEAMKMFVDCANVALEDIRKEG